MDSMVSCDLLSNFQPDERRIVFDWHAKVPFEIRQGRYIVKTAQTPQEFMQVINLRNQVFLREFASTTDMTRSDIEERDAESDFLIIKDSQSSEVLATYRLISSHSSQDFYSCSEFEISDFLRTPGRKLELSRACVSKERRSAGIFVHLLWRGLGEYIKRTESRYLFGCSSIQSIDLRQLIATYRYITREDALGYEYDVSPHVPYRIFDIEGLRNPQKLSQIKASSEHLPALLLGYLTAGAKIYGAPAFDQDFNCLDLFTVLDLESLAASHIRKYIGS